MCRLKKAFQDPEGIDNPVLLVRHCSVYHNSWLLACITKMMNILNILMANHQHVDIVIMSMLALDLDFKLKIDWNDQWFPKLGLAI